MDVDRAVGFAQAHPDKVRKWAEGNGSLPRTYRSRPGMGYADALNEGGMGGVMGLWGF